MSLPHSGLGQTYGLTVGAACVEATKNNFAHFSVRCLGE